MIIVGIDPGSSELGVSIIEIDDITFRVKGVRAEAVSITSIYGARYYKLGPATDTTPEYRMELIDRALFEILSPYTITAVCIEDAFFNPKRAFSYASLMYHRTKIISELQSTQPWLSIYSYPPKQIKRIVGSKDLDTKQGTKDALKESELVNFIDIDNLTEDAVDGLAAAWALCLQSF